MKKTIANGFSSHTPLGIKNTLKYFLLLFNLYNKRIKIMSASLIKRGRHFLCNCHIDVTRYAFFIVRFYPLSIALFTFILALQPISMTLNRPVAASHREVSQKYINQVPQTNRPLTQGDPRR